MTRYLTVFLLVAFLAAPTALRAQDDAATTADAPAAAPVAGLSPQFMADLDALTGGGHRLTGSENIQAAGDHVIARLRELGVAHIFEQTFDIPTLSSGDAYLQSGDDRIELQPMRPNLTIPPVTPKEGVRGRLVDVGSGQLAEYPADFAVGDIVVMDFNSGKRWLQAIRMGAVAVIFQGQDDMDSQDEHFTYSPANILRFYHGGDRESLPIGETVSLHSEMPWSGGIGRNIIAIIPGTDAQFKEEIGEEATVLAAALDSYGEVPAISPGARSAANVAALLQIAADLQAKPARRHVVLAFFDASAWGHSGAGKFYRLFDPQAESDNASLTHRIEVTEKELEFQRAMLDVIETDAYPPVHPDKGRVLSDDVNTIAATHVDALKDRLAVARLDVAAEVDGATERVEAMETDKNHWNNVRRHLGKRLDTWPEEAEVDERLKQALDTYREIVAFRIDELQRIREQQAVESAIVEQLDGKYINLHVSMLLGDRTGRWGLVVGDASNRRSQFDVPGVYTRVQSRFLDAVNRVTESGKTAHAEVATMNLNLSQADGALASGYYTHSGAIAGKLAIYNVALGTIQEAFDNEGTPSDTVERLDLANMSQQLGGIRATLRHVLNDPELALARGFRRWSYYSQHEFEQSRVQGTLALSTSAGGSSIPNSRTPGVVIALTANALETLKVAPIPAFNDFALVGTDLSGAINYGPIMRVWQDKVNGFASTFDERGVPRKVGDSQTSNGYAQRVNLYETRHGNQVLPTTMVEDMVMNVLDGPSNGPMQPKKNFFKTVDGVSTWYVDKKYKRVKLFHNRGIAVLGTQEASDESAADAPVDPKADDMVEVFPGTGYGISARPAGKYDINQQAAHDIWRLNESRLSVLRERGIMNGSLEELHGRAEDLWLAGDNAKSVAESQANAVAAIALQTKTYSPVRSMMDDLVKAVLILLALSVPFAYSLERLLIGATSIYKQLLFFVVFFLATFLLLYVSHPAFAIAATPIIIFLAFTIVVLAAAVIVIIMQKFEQELKILQGMESTVHAADVSRLSTVLAAMSMGISSMRRRPLRTALTAVTIILLTFTILGFASFGSQKAVLTFFLQPSVEYAGVFVHQLSWQPISGDMAGAIREHWGKDTPMTERRWLSPQEKSSTRVVLSLPDGNAHMALSALLGLQEEELQYRAKLANLLKTDAPFDDTVWMTISTAQRLGVNPGDHVLVNGRELIVGQLIDPVAIIALTDLDESSILPVDFDQMSSSGGQTSGAGDPSAEDLASAASQSWQSVSPDATLIVSADTARDMDAKLHALAFYPDSISAASRLSDDLARVLTMPVAGSRSDGVYRHVLGDSLAASGLKSLIFPILLGGLVIFGTMLGSVADREKEIYTFSALGLAPPHVAGLFFAEAMIYSVIGGLGGYLLAQGSMKIMEVLASQGLVRVPEMNYSSTNAIVTILLVMITVMISAIYPAIKASRSANPGVMRTWRIPQPDGDVLDMTFPFTVSEYDITGVVSFLKEHFDSFSDVGLGVFMTMNSELIRTESGNLGLKAEIALAPFDLGVTQSFTLTSTPSGIEGIDEVAITLVRLSGQPKDWQRQNKVLLDDLRKQFLLWRALPAETMEMYRLRTMDVMGSSLSKARQAQADSPDGTQPA